MPFQLGQLGWPGRGLGSIDHIAGVPNQGTNTPSIIFSLPLLDLGGGAVDTTPTINGGSGTPTFTRATVGWTKLSTGLWASVASGTARSGYYGANTAVGTYGGYFTEGAGIQLVTPDASIRDMTDASWVAVNVTPVKDATGIDGVVNSATTLTSGAIGGSIQQTLVAAATSRTYSVWLRRKTGTGTITINQGATTSDITSLINSTTYTRVALNATVLNAAFGITFGTSGDAVEADFNQFESGAFATSPMATAGAVRAADLLNYVTAGNISSTASSVVLSVMANAIVTGMDNFMLGFGGNYALDFFSTGTATFIYDGTNNPSATGGTTAIGNTVKVGASWGSGVLAIANGGVTETSSFDGSMNIGVSFAFGSLVLGMGPLNGFIKTVNIYGGSLTSGQLGALTV